MKMRWLSVEAEVESEVEIEGESLRDEGCCGEEFEDSERIRREV